MQIKKFLSILLTAAVVACLFAGCAGNGANDEVKDDGRLKVVCTLFPQYDFVRAIAGDKVNLSLLLAPGVKCHSYVPEKEELANIEKAALFIYTGDYMEPWVAEKTKSFKATQTFVLDASKGIVMDVDMMNDELAEAQGSEDHVQLLEPHIWTVPLNAAKMVDTITGELCRMDAKNAGVYKANAAAYKTKLDALDAGFRGAVKSGKRKNVVFADRFAFYYFVKEYSLGYLSAYDLCTTEIEPSEATLDRLANAVVKSSAPVVFYRELSDQKTAKLLSERTGVPMLLFHACENLSQAETDAGATYLSLMEQNLENLRVALG